MLWEIYRLLLRLHPRQFRERFSAEMLDIFDAHPHPARLLPDALASLIRQWLFRPHAPAPAPAAAATGHMFLVIEPYQPPRRYFMQGAFLSAFAFLAVGFASTRGGNTFPLLQIGSLYPRPNVLAIDRDSIMGTQPTTEVKIPTQTVEPIYKVADAYYRIIRVLNTLDRNHDRDLSAEEIAAAPTRLRILDLNSDGKLSPAECGFSLGNTDPARFTPEWIAGAQRVFMSFNPALAAIDTNRDAELSPAEIVNAPFALRTLDKNRDGGLTPIEVLPDLATSQRISRERKNKQSSSGPPRMNKL